MGRREERRRGGGAEGKTGKREDERTGRRDENPPKDVLWQFYAFCCLPCSPLPLFPSSRLPVFSSSPLPSLPRPPYASPVTDDAKSGKKKSNRLSGGGSPGADADWLESLESVLEHLLKTQSRPQATAFVDGLVDRLRRAGLTVPPTTHTPYVNTIPVEEQPEYPGDWKIETRIKSIIRWNAMAMVVNANRKHNGLGGHISTYASLATLYEVGYNYFFRGGDKDQPADQIFFQGHATPGNYARAFLEGRLDERHLQNFRQELAEGGGLSSYPHPYLMPGFWQFPTVSMGLGPLLSIYQARFNRYLKARGFIRAQEPKVWCFVGDGETDEPESLE